MSITDETVVEPIDDTPSEGADPVATEEVDGQVEATDPSEQAPTPEDDVLDLSAFDGKYVEITVQGEKQRVPVTELPNGYMRQADYTQKTQEVAFWRQVDQAMRNPQTAPAALRYLADAFGVEAAQAVQDQYEGTEEEEYADPIERRLAEIEARTNAIAEREAEQQAAAYLNQVVDSLSQKYPDFNAVEVVTEAVNRGISDPGALEDVYKLMRYDALQAQTAAQSLAVEQRAAQEAARQAAAAQAASVVSSGGSANDVGGGTPTPNPRPRTVAEAWALARSQAEG